MREKDVLKNEFSLDSTFSVCVLVSLSLSVSIYVYVSFCFLSGWKRFRTRKWEKEVLKK